MTTSKETLIGWLKDAYSMETSLVPTLENHAKDAKALPQAQQRIHQHAEATKRHADLVKSCIERLGGDISGIKVGISNITGMLKEIPMTLSDDEVVKNALADFATENFEIAAYNALIAAAQQLGDQETVNICRQILQDEQDMAQWLHQHLSEVVNHYLGQQTRSAGA